MNWNLYQARTGNMALFIDRKSGNRWELWCRSPRNGHRRIGSDSSPKRCMELITPEVFARLRIAAEPRLFVNGSLHWIRCSLST